MSRFVYIVGDRPDARETLRTALESQGPMHLIPCRSGDAFMDELADREPGCVLLDVPGPSLDGLSLIARLSGRTDLWPVVVVADQGSVPSAVHAIKLGALDYLEKPVATGRLVAALDGAQERIDRLSAAALGTGGAHRRFARLSARERDVVAALLDGCSNKQVAHRLSIGLRTVEVHRANIMAKLEVESVAALVKVALIAGEPAVLR